MLGLGSRELVAEVGPKASRLLPSQTENWLERSNRASNFNLSSEDGHDSAEGCPDHKHTYLHPR